MKPTGRWASSSAALPLEFYTLDLSRHGRHSVPRPSALQPAGCERNVHSPQLVSSLISGQSGLLSHRYSMRIHVPSPHLCSSCMQSRTSGTTGGDGQGTVGRMSNVHATARLQPRQAGHNGVTTGSRRQISNTGETGNYNVTWGRCSLVVLHWV